MSPSYTSLIKKVKEFSKRFDYNNIFYCYINQRRHREKKSVTPGEASRRMIFTFANLLCNDKKVSRLPVVQGVNDSWLAFHLNFAI